MTTTVTSDLLATIVAATRRAVDVRQSQRPIAQLEQETVRQPRGEAFAAALRSSPAPRIIAECKRRSPSRGIIRANYDAAAHARAYEAAGAAAISVLTEPTFFDGAPEHLRAVRAAVSIPVLRKDFIVTDYQVHEAAWLGADAVLLIVGALDDRELQRLLALATERGLAALVEVHDEEELARAQAAGARIIGVNSRNLRTLSVDTETLERLSFRLKAEATKEKGSFRLQAEETEETCSFRLQAEETEETCSFRLQAEEICVAESGIRTAADIARLTALGYDAFLVGERLIAQPDPGAALRELRQA